MRKKAVLLLLIFLTSLIPTTPAKAEDHVAPSINDAVNFLYLSDAILTPENELDLSDDTTGKTQALALTSALPDQVDIKPLLGRIIHAKKMERNDLDANCRLLVNQLQAEGRKCEADQVRAYCKQKRAEINTLIGYYRNKRGDQRKFFTRVWHNIKRNARNFWSKIGPVGRNFLRKMGSEALQIVASGGTLSGGVLKKLIRNYVKSVARNRIKQVVYQGVERMLLGQLEIAQAAGVDLCDEDAKVVVEEDGKIKIVTSPSDETTDSARWECADVDGPVSDMLEARKDDDSAIINYYDVDHTFLYSADPPKLQYNYTYEYSEDWETLLDDGSLGWVTHTWSGHYEASSVAVDEYGVFTIPATWTEKRDQTTSSITAEVQYTHNFWGLLPPDNHQTIYLCSWGPREMPTGLETLSPDNFKDRCGPQTLGSWYFECYLTP